MPVSVTNFSFELDAASPGGVATNIPTGWTAFNQRQAGDIGSQNSGGGDYSVFNPLAVPADGNQYCYINMFTPGLAGGIYQDVGPLQPNTTYALTAVIGSRADRVNSPGIISLINGADNTGIVLAAGGGLPAAPNTWQDYPITFTTGPAVSGDLTVELSVLGNSSTIQSDFDNVQLNATPLFPTVPTLAAPIVSGGNLIVVGTGGTPNFGYTWLATTNLSPPVQWTTNSAGTLDGTGSFSNVLSINNALTGSFFKLEMP
jgi:hypothetical protein